MAKTAAVATLKTEGLVPPTGAPVSWLRRTKALSKHVRNHRTAVADAGLLLWWNSHGEGKVNIYTKTTTRCRASPGNAGKTRTGRFN